MNIKKEDTIETVVCPLHETGPGNVRNGEGSGIELNDGRLFLAYSCYSNSAEDFAPASIMGKISEDRGRTWTKPFEIVPNDARVNVGRLSLVRITKEWPSYGGWFKGKSSVALIYTKLAGPYHDGVHIRISRDECRTWSKEERINPLPSSYIYTAHLNDTAVEISGNRQ